MRHLIDPLVLQKKKQPGYWIWQNLSHCIPMHTVMLPITRSSLHFSMSQVPEPVYLLSLPC